MKYIDDMLEADPHYQELLRIQKQKMDSAVEEALWFVNESCEYEEAAEEGDVEAMYQCFIIYAIHEGFINHGYIYSGEDAIGWLVKAVKNGHTGAIITYIGILLTGKYKDFHVNISIDANYAFTCCSYFTEEALKDEKISQLVEEVKELAEKEKQEEQVTNDLNKRMVIGVVFVVVILAIYIMMTKG